MVKSPNITELILRARGTHFWKGVFWLVILPKTPSKWGCLLRKCKVKIGSKLSVTQRRRRVEKRKSPQKSALLDCQLYTVYPLCMLFLYSSIWHKLCLPYSHMAKKDDGTKVVGKNANKYRATAPIKIRHTSKNVTSGKNILADLGLWKQTHKLRNRNWNVH